MAGLGFWWLQKGGSFSDTGSNYLLNGSRKLGGSDTGSHILADER